MNALITKSYNDGFIFDKDFLEVIVQVFNKEKDELLLKIGDTERRTEILTEDEKLNFKKYSILENITNIAKTL